ncbi:DNA double-strand break repair nuclease NurA [Flectobacillus rivi]|uniref:DNA double-strand break repair nuclease NurA n=1 Tax=Flectobacillus rivi TaxID=2984209 RepID=A0ABT6YXW2_9BACT|nr:DNA double-strand break repair nuclease NurA [Flectobacillus rivi]MDI9873610.1 DNA double-strand break repair nuclease NurA [Flectobacillus rivi]
MSFEGEFASYEPLRRLLDSEKVKALQNRLKIRQQEETEDFEGAIVNKSDLTESTLQPDLVLAIDGSYLASKAENGFPGAEFGYVTVASVLIDLKLIGELEKKEFVEPKKFRETEKASTIDSVFPGCNVILDEEKDAKASLRRALFEELKSNTIFTDGETLLETYEHLFKIKREHFKEKNLPRSPIEGIEEEMTYDYGEYICPHSGESLFSTDALRLHELMNTGGSNGEMFGQIMSTLEKLWLVHILRAFERKGWLATLRRVAFVMDGPLAVFSTSSWLTKVISYELSRLNDLQKKTNGQDLLIIGIEKSGTFFNHFIEIDTTKDGVTDKFPKQSALLLNDNYIKRNIIFSESTKPYGQDTYFGRKLFYKAASGQKIVPVVACFDDYQRNIDTAYINQFTRLADVLNLLDQLVSNRYPNSISPLVSAHAEAAIPLNLGRRIFEDIANEIKKKSRE